MSVLPMLMGQPQDLSDRVMYWEFYERGFQQAIRQGRWKGVKLSPDAPWELYDLSEDPSEITDVAAEHPDVVTRFERFAEEDRVESSAWPQGQR